MHKTLSPDNTDGSIEQLIIAKGKTAARVTPADLTGSIRSAQYHVFAGSQLTVCVLTLQNGFTVTGESACASPENFDREIGERVSFENAKQKIWPLLGYLLKQQLHTIEHAQPPATTTFQDRVRIEQQQLAEKLTALTKFNAGEIFKTLTADEQARLTDQLSVMSDYDFLLRARIAAF